MNTGAARPATLTGFPAGLKEFRVWITDSKRGMQECDRIPVRDGRAELKLDPTSFTMLVSVQ